METLISIERKSRCPIRDKRKRLSGRQACGRALTARSNRRIARCRARMTVTSWSMTLQDKARDRTRGQVLLVRRTARLSILMVTVQKRQAMPRSINNWRVPWSPPTTEITYQCLITGTRRRSLGHCSQPCRAHLAQRANTIELMIKNSIKQRRLQLTEEIFVIPKRLRLALT